MNPETRSRIRRLLAGGREVVLALGMVIVLALIFVAILTVSFPRGSGLAHLYSELVTPGSSESTRELTLAGEPGELVARLVRVERDVRDRPASAIAWSSATEGQSLEDRHTIQTLERSSALIEIQGANRLEMGPNSLVVLKRPELQLGRRRSASLVILGGRVRGTAGGADKAAPLEFVTSGGARTSILPADGADEAEFAVTVNGEDTSVFSILSGGARIRTETGVKEVRANQSLVLSKDNPDGAIADMPRTPALRSPRSGTRITQGAIAESVRFSWQRVGLGASYLLEIATDQDFSELLHGESLTTAEFTHGNLDAGRYFWRVRAIEDGVESRPSDPRVLVVESDLVAPVLVIDLPDTVDGDTLTIRGSTEPGAELLIADVPVDVDRSGNFEYELKLEPGLNMVVIEAVDSAGNGTYHSRYITARY